LKYHSKISFLLAVMVSFLCFIATPVSAADQPIKVSINGVFLTFDQPPVIISDRTMVPFRAIFEAMGSEVQWDATTRTVTAEKDGTVITLQIGSKKALKNGSSITLDVPALIVNGRTMVPLRFVGEAFGYEVIWNANTRTVSINTQSNTGKVPLKVEDIAKQSNKVVKLEIYNAQKQLIGVGSGFVVDSSGKIITNYHVIEEAALIKVIFHDGTSYWTDTFLSADPVRDLALIKIEAKNLPYVTLGDSSKIKLGEQVVAIGSPIGLQNTVSTGVISSTQRVIDNQNYVQISVPIDHGSSGGALFNMYGEVIGVTTGGYDSIADLNLCIPSNEVKTFLTLPQVATKLNPVHTFDPKQFASFLNENYGYIQLEGAPGLTLYYEVEVNDEGKVNIYSVLEDIDEYIGLIEFEDEIEYVSALMLHLLLQAHEAGAKEPLILMVTDFDVSSIVEGYPEDEFHLNSDGSYRMNHIFGKALLQDDGKAIYTVEPHINPELQEHQLVD
jgi:serine protease Do